MTKGLRRLGLDELMIVNPQPPGGPAALFLGDDGVLYRIDASAPDGASERTRVDVAGDPGRFLLGEDGTVYEIVG